MEDPDYGENIQNLEQIKAKASLNQLKKAMWGWICKERVQNCVEGRMSNTLEDLCKYSFTQLLKGASQNMQRIFRLFKDDFSFSFVRLFKNA